MCNHHAVGFRRSRGRFGGESTAQQDHQKRLVIFSYLSYAMKHVHAVLGFKYYL